MTARQLAVRALEIGSCALLPTSYTVVLEQYLGEPVRRTVAPGQDESASLGYRAIRLVLSALAHVERQRGMYWPAADAEAAQWLREGWSPGE